MAHILHQPRQIKQLIGLLVVIVWVGRLKPGAGLRQRGFCSWALKKSEHRHPIERILLATLVGGTRSFRIAQHQLRPAVSLHRRCLVAIQGSYRVRLRQQTAQFIKGPGFVAISKLCFSLEIAALSTGLELFPIYSPNDFHNQVQIG